MSFNPSSLERHIIEHEILGIDTGFSGSGLSSLKVDGGRLWIYDSVRGKWLSSDTVIVTASRKGRAKNKYLDFENGVSSLATGFRITGPATIIGLAAQTRAQETWTIHVRKNNTETNIASLSINNLTGSHNNALNINLEEGDFVQFYAETTSFLGIKDPKVWLKIAWRNDNL